jgi:hypothetical protein
MMPTSRTTARSGSPSGATTPNWATTRPPPWSRPVSKPNCSATTAPFP